MKRHANSAGTVIAVMAMLTLGSKCFGFIREMFLANYFGTSYVVDAYVMSMNIPLVVVQGIPAAIAITFIPQYAKHMEDENKLAADLFTSRMLNLLVIISLVVSCIGILFSDKFVYVFAHGWYSNPEMQAAIDLSIFFVKIAFSAILFSTIASILDAWQQYHHHYYTPIVVNYGYSISIIIFIIIAHRFGNHLIIFGVLAGMLIRAGIDSIAVRCYKNNSYRHRWSFRFEKAIKRTMVLAVPVFIGTQLNLITQFVDKLMASWLPEGSVSALNYASLVVNLFAVLIGTMLSTYMYPMLSRAYAADRMEEWENRFATGFNVLYIIGIPITFGCILYSKNIVRLIYERNAFDATSTDMTSTAFVFYSILIVFQILTIFMTQTFYSAHNTRTPVIISSICAGLNVIGNLILIKPLGIGGIALSTSIAMVCNMVILVIMIQKKQHGVFVRNMAKKIVFVSGAAIVSVGVSFVCFNIVRAFLGSESAGSSLLLLLSLLVAVMIAAGMYYLLLRIMKVEEVRHIRQILKIVGRNK